MLRPNSGQAGRLSVAGEGVAVAGSDEPGETGKSASASGKPALSEEELARRRLGLDATLAERNRQRLVREASGSKTTGTVGYGQALKLSSEFIAGIAVGAGLGWIIDRLAGTTPWGLVVFLLLGFGAGVLNVMRSAGVVAEAGIRAPDKAEDRSRKR